MSPVPTHIPLSFETERLIVRRTEAGDGQAFSEAIIETWDQLYKYAPWAKTHDEHTPEKEEELSLRCHNWFNDRTMFVMAVYEKQTNRFLGRVELFDINWEDRTMETGYWFRQSAMGQRYGSEAMKGMIDFGFDVLGARQIIAVRNDDNEASRRLLARLGFIDVTIAEDVPEPKTGTTYTQVCCVLER
jgi:RimJ/RimL family protein N-acetyltransferase